MNSQEYKLLIENAENMQRAIKGFGFSIAEAIVSFDALSRVIKSDEIQKLWDEQKKLRHRMRYERMMGRIRNYELK